MDGAKIRTLRKQLGLTQEEFAHEIGVTFATVNRWENGKSKPSRLALRRLAEQNETLNPAPRKPSGGRSRKGRSSRRS